MKPKEKRMIAILVIITIIMLIITIVVKNNSKKAKEEKQAQPNESETSFVQQNENGVKTNTSDKLKETKKVGDFEISNISITEVNGVATVQASVMNTSSIDKKEFPLKLKLLNEKGEVIQEVGAYVGKIKQGETRGINASVNMDISNIKDIQFEM